MPTRTSDFHMWHFLGYLRMLRFALISYVWPLFHPSLLRSFCITLSFCYNYLLPTTVVADILVYWCFRPLILLRALLCSVHTSSVFITFVLFLPRTFVRIASNSTKMLSNCKQVAAAVTPRETKNFLIYDDFCAAWSTPAHVHITHKNQKIHTFSNFSKSSFRHFSRLNFSHRFCFSALNKHHSNISLVKASFLTYYLYRLTGTYHKNQRKSNISSL